MVADYKYLIATLLGLAPLTLVLVASGPLRSTAIVGGLVLAAYSPPVAWLYERAYWTPGRLFGGDWGIEDVLFCFHAGAVSWVCASVPWRNSLRMSPAFREGFHRLLLITLPALSILALLIGAGVGKSASFLIMQTASTAFILMIRKDYFRFIASVAPTFILYYFITLNVWRLLLPGFLGMWTGTELSGWKLMGVPIEEYLWVLSFSTGFTITMAFVFDVRFSERTTKASVFP